MLEAGDHAVRSGDVSSLETAHVGSGIERAKIRVFAKAFGDAAPTQVTRGSTMGENDQSIPAAAASRAAMVCVRSNNSGSQAQAMPSGMGKSVQETMDGVGPPKISEMPRHGFAPGQCAGGVAQERGFDDLEAVHERANAAVLDGRGHGRVRVLIHVVPQSWPIFPATSCA